MKIAYLKQVLLETGTSEVNKVYFDRNHIVNTDRDKDYPYVFWDLNTFNSIMNWRDTTKQKEAVTMTAYCIGYHDKEVAGGNVVSIEEVFDELREAFRTYLTVLNENGYLEVTNLNAMQNELYQIGLTIDAEVGVSFRVTMNLFCNVAE